MSARSRRLVLQVGVALVVAVALVAVGRWSADTGSARDSGLRAGYSDGHYAGYFAGLHDGEAQGLREGRAVQLVSTSPPGMRRVARHAFEAGYAAGTNDVFAGYDGGWALGSPYLVTLEAGIGQADYRIDTRTAVEAGVSYFLCPSRRGVCQRPNR
jgi:hypothetical protein